MYPSADAYVDRYADAVDTAIAAGVVLEADREAIEAYARPELIPG